MSDSSYDSSQFNVERATTGLVLTLYLGAAIFLILIVWMVMRSMPANESAPAEAGTESRTLAPAPADPARLAVADAARVVDAEPLLAYAPRSTSSSNLPADVR
jgi:hypothetical protein